MHRSAMWAKDDQTFWPEIRQPSPSGSARAWREARSLPEPGSLKPWHQISSPVSMGRRYLAFCSSEPAAMMVGPAIPVPISPTCSGASALASSS
jgi:hypothetical protein